MRVLIFHGYLLRGTGSNIYNVSLVRALADLGHEVHLLCQERDPSGIDSVDAVGSWDHGELKVEELRSPVRVTVYRPEIGRVLPVYVADHYEDFDAVPFPELDEAAVEQYIEANVQAVRAVCERVRPDVALANHLVMGPAILARALGGKVPYAVKVHGSALEYTVRPHSERFLPYAAEGLDRASAVLVGSGHTARSLWEVTGIEGLADKTRLGPPGVDVDAFRPRTVDEARAGLRELAQRLEGAAAANWGGEEGAAAALAALDPERDRIVSYVGKLIVSKGVHLLLAAWPLVVAAVPDARLCIVGFGAYRDTLGALLDALAVGDLGPIDRIAALGRGLEGGPPQRLAYLSAFLAGLDGERRAAYLAAAPGAARRVTFTGRLEHGDLPGLLPACEAQVVPSTFPEAFGMVAAEAAACGALPLSAAHSGLAEVSTTLARALDDDLRELLSFEHGPESVAQIADKLIRWLSLEPARRSAASAAIADLARRIYGWEGVALGVIAAAEGRLSELPHADPSG